MRKRVKSFKIGLVLLAMAALCSGCSKDDNGTGNKSSGGSNADGGTAGTSGAGGSSVSDGSAAGGVSGTVGAVGTAGKSVDGGSGVSGGNEAGDAGGASGTYCATKFGAYYDAVTTAQQCNPVATMPCTAYSYLYPNLCGDIGVNPNSTTVLSTMLSEYKAAGCTLLPGCPSYDITGTPPSPPYTCKGGPDRVNQQWCHSKCETKFEAYEEAVATAQQCNPAATVPCTAYSYLCGDIGVNPNSTTALSTMLSEYKAAGCVLLPLSCPVGTASPTPYTCKPGTDGGVNECVSVHGG